MLKILFSPSEGKKSGGTLQESKLFGATEARDIILNQYNAIVTSNDEEAIKSLFGMKKWSDCEPYLQGLFSVPLMKAVERYSGVAYEYLDYENLNSQAQEYLQKNLIIFSNLYGPLLGEDTIANYKVKQGNAIGDISPDKFYKERFSYQLDLFLTGSEILDLRAGYYDKFYKTTQEYTTLKFLKNGKTVSHWAKAYRGIVLKEIAKAGIDSLESFSKLEINGLQVQEIKKTKNKTEIIYNIID